MTAAVLPLSERKVGSPKGCRQTEKYYWTKQQKELKYTIVSWDRKKSVIAIFYNTNICLYLIVYKQFIIVLYLFFKRTTY